MTDFRKTVETGVDPRLAQKTRDSCFDLVPVDVSYIRKILDNSRPSQGCWLR